MASTLSTTVTHAEPLPLKVGEANLYPSFKLSFVSTDNTFASNEVKTESTGWLAEPKLLYVADKGANELRAGYEGEYLVSELDAASFADHRLFLNGEGVFSRRSSVLADLSFDIAHFDFGSSLSRGETGRRLDEPYIYNELKTGLRYQYGARGARGNLTTGLNLRNRDYTNEPDPENPNRTDGLAFTSITPFIIFSLRVSGDTRAFLDLRFDRFDFEAFDNPNVAERDQDRVRAFVGTSWDVTGRSGGSFKIGSLSRSYKDSRREDNTIVGYELDAFYDIKSYSKLAVGFFREQDDLAESDELGRRDIFNLVWSHKWSSRVNTRFSAVQNISFDECVSDGNEPDREITEVKFGGELNLQLKRWLAFGMGVQRVNGDAETCTNGDITNFDDNIFERTRIDAHVEVTL